MLLQLIHLLNTNRVFLNLDGNGVFKDIKIAVPLKYLSNSWRS